MDRLEESESNLKRRHRFNLGRPSQALNCCLLLYELCVRVCFAARSKSMVMGEVTRGPCRPASPSLQEGALKAGWLKKQRSIMKNWQLRWFVLRSDQLFFYKDEEETKPQVRESLFAPLWRRSTLGSIQSTSVTFRQELSWVCYYWVIIWTAV